MNPLVSIITIVYNAEKDLRECIESVQKQTYKNIEYIIIDGGSTDSSIDIIKEHSEHISHWVSEKDKGISDAFNKGIQRATGEIVGILNADDRYLPDAIDRVVSAYEQEKGQSGIYYGDARLTYFEDTHAYEMVPNIENIWKYMSIYHPACFVTADVYRQYGGYSTDYRFAMDADFVHRCLVNKVHFFHVHYTLTCFRSGGASDKNMFKGYKEFYRSVRRYNPGAYSELHFWKGVLKAYLLKTALGKLLHKNKRYLNFFLTAKVK